MPPRSKIPALGNTKLFEPIKIGRMELKHRSKLPRMLLDARIAF